MKKPINQFIKQRKYLSLFIAGALADLALAPFYLFPVLFISFPLFFKILNSAKNRQQAFKFGWMFGFGYFVFGLYWIANSLLVDAEKFAWLIPFSVCGIPFLLAIYIGLMSVAYHHFKTTNISLQILLLASLWVVFELLRGWLFTGFPWNLIGYAALASLTFSQVAAIGGIYLLSYLVVIIALIPAYYKNHLFLPVMILIFSGFIFGWSHMNQKTESARTAKILIFQPNIPQTLKWDREMTKMQFLQSVEYSRGLNFKDKDIVLWPETGVPYYLNSQPWVGRLLQQIAPDNGLLITGGLRSAGKTTADYKIWNTLYAITRDKIYQSYDKIHLVPFGEFVPFRNYLPLDKITPGNVDFSSGHERNIIKYRDGPSFLALICYEVIFPEYSRAKTKPDLLINITNDGWFGNSTGPYQHLAMARMRSIEEGMPLLRAANTGVSAIVDSRGRVVNSLGYNQRGFIENKVDLTQLATLYNLCGNYLILGLIALNFGLIFGLVRKTQIRLARHKFLFY